MADDRNFVVRNGITVNGSFTANSTAVNASAITATSVNAASIIIGANVVANTTVFRIGNTTVNTSIVAGQITISGTTVNSTVYSATANNSTNFNGQPASFYANATNLTSGTVAAARLGSGTANSSTFLAGDQSFKTAVTSVSAGNGLSGGPITSTGSLSVLANNSIIANATGVYVNANNGLVSNASGLFINANNGVTSNASGLFVTQGTGAVVNSTGVHVNATYIATLTVNSSVFSASSPTNTFTVGTSGYFVTNGNFGLGTSTPGSKLEVIGRISTTGQIATTNAEMTIGTGQNEEKRLRLQNANTNLYFYISNTTFGLYSVTSAANRWTSDVSGNFTATGNITAYSDIRLKTNINTIENALNTLSKLRGVRYQRKADRSDQIGVIAQEVEQIVPEVVIEDSEGTLSVAYGNLVGLLIEAVKELSTKVDELEKKVIVE
jgi:hypothetical protein